MNITKRILEIYICSFMTAIDKLCYLIIYNTEVFFLFSLLFLQILVAVNIYQETENMFTFWDILDRYAD